MIELNKYLKSNPVVYVTRDLERALGLPLNTPGYYIVANYSNFANSGYKNKKNVLLIKADKPLSTHELLEHADCINFIKKIGAKQILVFKNNALIEKTCQKHHFTLLNPSANFASRIEEKISQVEWLGELSRYLPHFQVKTCNELNWRNQPFILQFNSAHTGTGTFLIESAEELKQIQEQFPKRPAKASQYVAGPLFTNNNVVSANGVLHGNISYQITGLPPFTDNHYATIGNDWYLAKKILTGQKRRDYLQIAGEVGEKLRADGWRGLFGIDVIMSQDTGTLHLIEINARQPASTTFESILQAKTRKNKNLQMTTFEAHLSALLNLSMGDKKIAEIKTGAQIIQRLTRYRRTIRPADLEKMKKLGLNYFFYDTNSKAESDLLRIQTEKSFMKDHNVFNPLGRKLF